MTYQRVLSWVAVGDAFRPVIVFKYVLVDEGPQVPFARLEVLPDGGEIREALVEVHDVDRPATLLDSDVEQTTHSIQRG